MDDVSGLQNRTKDKIEKFVRRPNSYVEPRSRQYIFSCHDKSLFTEEISESEIMYSTKVYKSKRFNRDSILDVETYYKEIETFEYLNIYSYQ